MERLTNSDVSQDRVRYHDDLMSMSKWVAEAKATLKDAARRDPVVRRQLLTQLDDMLRQLLGGDGPVGVSR